MSRFLRRAALAAAVSGGLSSAVWWTTTSSPVPLFRFGSPSCPSTRDHAAATTGDDHLALVRDAALPAAVSGDLSSAVSWTTSSRAPLFGFGAPSSPPSTRDPASATTGDSHLALVRAHPRLRELNAMLTQGDFLVDATQALLAAALRHAPWFPGTVRDGRDLLAAQIQSADSDGGDEEQAASARMNMAFLDARDGRHEDALEALALLAAERPGLLAPRLDIFAAVLCYMLGRPEEGARWFRDADVPDLSRADHRRLFLEAVMIASQGRTPRVAAASEELVLLTLHGMVEYSMWCVFMEGDLSERIQVLALMAFLRGAVARSKFHRDDAAAARLHGSQDATPPQAS
ncbi:hypothetical protein EJB05_15748, partial [Eragrostis curvula]